MSVEVQIPRLDVAPVDPRTGKLTREWALFFQNLLRRTGTPTNDLIEQANDLRFHGAPEYQGEIGALLREVKSLQRSLALQPTPSPDMRKIQSQINLSLLEPL